MEIIVIFGLHGGTERRALESLRKTEREDNKYLSLEQRQMRWGQGLEADRKQG